MDLLETTRVAVAVSLFSFKSQLQEGKNASPKYQAFK